MRDSIFHHTFSLHVTTYYVLHFTHFTITTDGYGTQSKHLSTQNRYTYKDAATAPGRKVAEDMRKGLALLACMGIMITAVNFVWI